MPRRAFPRRPSRRCGRRACSRRPCRRSSAAAAPACVELAEHVHGARAGLRLERHGARDAPHPGRVHRAPRAGSPFFQQVPRGAASRSSCSSPRSRRRSACGATRARAICAVERDGGRFKLDKDATTGSYGEHADDLLVTCRRNAGRAAERSGARARAQGPIARSTQTRHVGHAGHARHVQPGLQADVVGRRGADPAGLVRRRLGADDGAVLAHPVVGACGSASRPTRSARAARSCAPRRARSPGVGAAARRTRLAEAVGRAADACATTCTGRRTSSTRS